MNIRVSHIILCTIFLFISTLSYAQDITLNRSSGDEEEVQDSIPETPPSKYRLSLDQIDCKVERASDSSRYITKTKIVEMYGNASITYCGNVLMADKIFYNTETGDAEAFGVKDSLGHILEYATFTEGGQEVQYEQLKYNFKSQRGKISQLVTKQGEGVVRGNQVKQTAPGEFFIKGTRYTTCNLQDPHYYFTFDKAKVKNDKFAAGKNLNLYIKDIPTPVYFPFAIFPLEQGKRAGFTRPAPAFDQQRGFNLSNVGWYQPISDSQDAIATVNAYTSGSWDLNVGYRYRKKYKYNATFNLSTSTLRGIDESVQDVLGDRLSNSFQANLNFNQDPKVWKNANLNASLNFGESNFKQINVNNPTERLTSTYRSSVSFNQTFPNSPFQISTAANYNQNTQTNAVTLSLPEGSISMSTIFPFRGLSKPGKPFFLENLNFSYRSNFRNQINTVDSIFFANPIGEISGANYGAQHTIPISASFKVLKHFTLSPGINYNEVWSGQNTVATYNQALQVLETDTTNIFRTARFYSTSVGLNTRIFGGKEFKNGTAIRHVITPTLSFGFNPDFTDLRSRGEDVIYQEQIDAAGTLRDFTLFDGSLFRPNLSESGGNIGLNINNNLELKVRNKNDSTGFKKIKIFESFDISTSYVLQADSLNLRPITVSGNTRLFDKVSINVAGLFQPYAINPNTGFRFDRFELSENGRLADFVSGNFRMSGSLKSKQGDGDQIQEVSLIQNPLYPGQQLFADNYSNSYIDFSIPWDLRLNYNLGFNKTFRVLDGELEEDVRVTNAVSGSVNLGITDEWRVDLNSGFDFVENELNFTRINILRDLHCWQMGFNWSPVGDFRNYLFSISPKSSLLSDLKVEKRRTQFDDF